jgi:membrane protein
LSLGLIVTLGFLMLVSLVVSAGVTAFGSYLSDLFPGAQLLVSLLNWTISFLLISLLFAAIYKILPDKPIVWRDVGVGSAVTAILFTSASP